MKRTPFKRKSPLRQRRREGADVEREQKPQALAPRRADAPRGTYAGATLTAAPKSEPARPGKRTPTKDEAAWMAAIEAYGCIACRADGHEPRPTAVHHIVSGNRRMGHKFTLPLCDPGHHQGGDALGLTSRHPWKARFEEAYGFELDLLAQLQGVLKLQPDGSYAP